MLLLQAYKAKRTGLKRHTYSLFQPQNTDPKNGPLPPPAITELYTYREQTSNFPPTTGFGYVDGFVILDPP